jgi:hypothetical protein
MQLCDRIFVLREGSIASVCARHDFDENKLRTIMVGCDIPDYVKSKEKINRDNVYMKKLKFNCCGIINDVSVNLKKDQICGIFCSEQEIMQELLDILWGNEDFLEWVREFPSALQKVMTSNDFKIYLQWEESWISQQNKLLKHNLQIVQKILDICKQRYNSAVNKISIILNPIKCTYSSDYIKMGDELYFILGSFRIESIIHEYLHHVVHHFILKYNEFVLKHTAAYPGIDQSYYLNGDINGKLNAFEEFIVRKLTLDISNMCFPLDLDEYIKECLINMN